MTFEDCSSVAVRQDLQYLGHLGKQLPRGLCGNQQLWEESGGEGYAILYENFDFSSCYSSEFFSLNLFRPRVRTTCFLAVVLFVCSACNYEARVTRPLEALSHLTET